MTKKKLDIQINIDWENINEKIAGSFDDVANNISRLYEHYLPSIETGKLQKINIYLSYKSDPMKIIPDSLKSSILTIYKPVDFDAFNNANLKELKQLVLRDAHKCLSIIFEKLEIDKLPLKLAFEQILRKNFELAIEFCGEPKLNPKKDILAVVVVEYFVGYALIDVVFFDKNNVMLKKLNLFKTVPHWFIYRQLIYSTKWINNEVFQLSNKNKEINIRIDSRGNTSMFYLPLGRDIEDLKKLIRFLATEIYIEI